MIRYLGVQMPAALVRALGDLRAAAKLPLAQAIAGLAVPHSLRTTQSQGAKKTARNYPGRLNSTFDEPRNYSRRSAIFSLMLAIALAGFRPLGQVVVQFID